MNDTPVERWRMPRPHTTIDYSDSQLDECELAAHMEFMEATKQWEQLDRKLWREEVAGGAWAGGCTMTKAKRLTRPPRPRLRYIISE